MDSKVSEALPACPFCGERPVGPTRVGDDDGGYVYVECPNNGRGDGHFCGVHADSAEEAVSVWRALSRDDVGRLREALRPFAYAFEQASIDGPCLSLEDVQAMFNLVSIYDFRKAHAAALTSAGDDVGRLREALERISSLSSLSFGFEAREIARAAIDALTGKGGGK